MWLLLASALAPANAQIWVAPRRAGQSVFRQGDLEWQTIELLHDEPIRDREAGGVRLFFYETERETAERAAALLEQNYRRLAEVFDFTPRKRFDYVLYGTYQEFLRTNLFPVQEGVLGVTSTRGLELALPYFGDHEMFAHTSAHELAHEFTIQKVRAAARDANVLRDPLDGFPLWFIEGLAELVALGPIDEQSAMRVRDLVTNPDVFTGHGILGFWDDFPGYTLWTYQGGHARLTFLEQTYGEGTAQRLLELSPAMVSDQGLAARIQRFERLVEEITGDEPEIVAERFDDWIKRRAYAEWLGSSQSFAELRVLERVVGVPLAFDGSPGGELLAYRSIAPDTGRSSLVVVDPRAPNRRRRLVSDGRPGVESLHPIDPRNFDVGLDRIAYVAEAKGRDRIVVQHLEHRAEREEGWPPGEPVPGEGTFPLPLEDAGPPGWWRVRIKKRGKDRYALGDHGIVAASAVALEPGGERFAVVGLDGHGVRDLYLATPDGERGLALVKLTDDVAAERDVVWGPRGLVYSSDASADGTWQLFTVSPGATPTRLTTDGRDHLSPTVLPDGTIVYVAYEDDDKAQLFATWDGAESTRLTDLAIGAFDPTPSADGGVWALVQHRGRLRPAQLRGPALEALPVTREIGPVGPPFHLEQMDLSAATPYRPLDPRNWAVDGGFAALGAGPGGVFGQLYLSASDRLRDHALIVVAEAYGTPELTDAQLLYLNQHGRITWGAGPFHALKFRIDRSLDARLLFQSGERYYGGLVSLRYPFDRFLYAQLDASVGGVSYFVFAHPTAEILAIPEANGSGRDLFVEWVEANPYPRVQTEGTVRFGVDTIRYHYKTGPLAGTSALVEATGGVQPFDDEVYGSLRTDVQGYVPIPFISGGNFGVKGSAATSGLGTYATGYWLSSYDTLRAYQWGDPDLLGRHYWFSSAELQIPLDVIIRLALASSIEGVAGLDFGGVGDEIDDLWDRRVLDGVLGTNFVIGPLVLRLHFANAIDVGAPMPQTASPWVTNFSISWLGQ